LLESQFIYQGIVLIGPRRRWSFQWKASTCIICPDGNKNNKSYPDTLICDPECGETEVCKEIDLQIGWN